MKLEIELVPKTAWFNNLRSFLTKEEWDIVRKKCYKEANHRCEVCGGTGDKWPVECHEIWEYTKSHKVKLKGLIALCPDCHEVKHIGLAQIRGRFYPALNHFMKVNNVSKQEAIKYVNCCFSLWNERNKVDWKLDVSYLKEYMEKS